VDELYCRAGDWRAAVAPDVESRARIRPREGWYDESSIGKLDIEESVPLSDHADSHIQTSPGARGGKPCLVGTRISVSDVVVMYLRLGLSLEEIAAKYELSLASVYAAMAYYHSNKEQIDKGIEEDEAFAQAFRENNPSLLQKKLQALTRA
jgi:uncharacterized protein (DUF433 family)